MSDANTTTPTPSVDNDNVMAAIATIPLVGLIMYYGIKDSSDLVKFYAKQSIGLLLVSIILSVVSFIVGFIPFIGLLVSCLVSIVGLGLGVIWLVLFINALQGKKFRLPVLADAVDQLIK